MRAILLLIALSLPLTARALSIEHYLDMSAEASSGSKDGQLAEFGLGFYLDGIAGAMMDQRNARGGILYYQDEKPLVCMSTTVDITVPMLRAAAESELVKNRALYEKAGGPQWLKSNMAPIFLFGLARVYPCAPLPYP